jgi:DNA-binding NarL/FixJ family response regulator
VSADTQSIRLLAVDDHALFRQGIAALVSSQSDMRLVAEAANGREAIEQFRSYRPNVTLMDLQMPEMSGVDATAAIRTEFPEARIIVLTTYVGDVRVRRAMQAGASAYLIKTLVDSELFDAVRRVHAGLKAMSEVASSEVALHATDAALTGAEVDVLRLIAAGNRNRQIASQLAIAEETVKGRVKKILAKLRANDRTHAAMIGMKRGIIES